MTRKRVVRPAGGISCLSARNRGFTPLNPAKKPRWQAVRVICADSLPPVQFKTKIKSKGVAADGFLPFKHPNNLTRSDKSAVAAAAYRAGETITNEYNGVTHDYTKKGGIVHTEIMLPGHAPAEYADRSTLRNAVEKTEKQCNSQLAREIEIALPAKLTHEQNISLVRGYVQDAFVNAGMVADVCFHDKDDDNPHVHIMLIMRPINENRTWGAKIKKDKQETRLHNRLE